MMKRVICCALALFLCSKAMTIAFTAPLSPTDSQGSDSHSIAQTADDGTESTASITGYGLLVPRATPGGGGDGNRIVTYERGTTILDGDLPLAGPDAIPETEIPDSAIPLQNVRSPHTGITTNMDVIWMLLLVSFAIILLAWPKKKKSN